MRARPSRFAFLTLAACAHTANPGDAPSPPGPPPAAATARAAPPPPAAGSARTAVDDVRDTALRTSEAWETVRSLTDECGPRLSGSPGGKAAVSWGVGALAAAGLTDVRAEPVSVPHWERGVETGELVSPAPHNLALTALGGSVGTPPGGVEGEVVMVDSLEALEKVDPSTLKGKIVFFDVKTERTRDGSGYGHAVRVRGLGAVEAARRGATAAVIRSLATDGSRMPHTGAMRYDPAVEKIPAAALSVPDAELLHRLVLAGKPVRLHLTLGCKTSPDVEGANVVGEVKGSEAPEEIVLLGAHLDSWDLGTGALDDGAGCGIVLEAGRQLARLARKPRRTVRVVLFANEENGLAGAKGYAKAHEAELPRHVVALESDLGAGKVYQALLLGPASARPAFAAVVAALAPLGVAGGEGDAEGGADLSPLRPFGVPFIDLRQDATRYFDLHHSANDTLDKIDRVELDQVAASFTATAFAAASSPEGFGRVPEEKRASKW